VLAEVGEEKYNLSFIGGGLLLAESTIVAEQYLKLSDWGKVEKIVMENNLLQSRVASTSKRFFSEIRNRLVELDSVEIEMLIDGDDRERRQLLWIAICRKYKFVRDFAIEILNSYYRNFKNEIDVGDYTAFFYEKMESHPELESLADSTIYKVRQILFKILREANLLSKDNMIIPTVVSIRLTNHIGDSELMVFPATH